MKRYVKMLVGIAFFMRAADGGKQTPYDYVKQGYQYEQEENYEQAVQCYEKALNGGCLTVLNNMGVAYECLHDQKRAERCYKMAIKAGDNNALVNLVALYADQKKFEEVKSLYYQGKDNCSPSHLMLIHLARAYWGLGDFKGAERAAKEAFALGDKRASYLLGHLYEWNNNVSEAKKWYAKACMFEIEGAQEKLNNINNQQEEVSTPITN